MQGISFLEGNMNNLSILKKLIIKASDLISNRELGSIKIVRKGTTKPKEIISEIPLIRISNIE